MARMEWKTDDQLNVEQLKAARTAKINELKSACTQAIYDGFKSESTGFEFGFNAHDQENFTQQMLLIVAANGNYTDPIRWKTKSGTVETLTVSKFISLIGESKDHKVTQQNKYWVLEQQVLNSQDVNTINAIKW